MADETIGYGTTLEFSTDGGSNWTEIARLTEIGEVNLGEPDDVSITGYDSPNAFKEYIPGLEDAGELDFTGIYTGTSSQTSLITLRRTVARWRIGLAGGLGTVSFDGFLKGPAINPQLDDRIEFSGSIKISGKPTYVA